MKTKNYWWQFWREKKPWYVCPKCAHSVTIGEDCPNPNCDDGWLT